MKLSYQISALKACFAISISAIPQTAFTEVEATCYAYFKINPMTGMGYPICTPAIESKRDKILAGIAIDSYKFSLKIARNKLMIDQSDYKILKESAIKAEKSLKKSNF